jgi:hypothetical protein
MGDRSAAAFFEVRGAFVTFVDEQERFGELDMPRHLTARAAWERVWMARDGGAGIVQPVQPTEPAWPDG